MSENETQPRTRAAWWMDALISPGLPLLMFIVGILCTKPWGNFPLNDDWQYAHIAQRFVEEGEIHLDRPIAPALITQTILGAAVIKVFGFSHTGLRALTLLVSLAGIVLVDAILRRVGSRAHYRAMAVSLFALNPFWFLLSASFMTEVYGTTPALLAVYLWIRGKDFEAPSLTLALLSALAGSVAYLDRQFSGIVVPALVLTSILLLSHRRPPDVRKALINVIAAGAVFVAVVLTHQLWIRGTGNYTPQFADPLQALMTDKWDTVFVVLVPCFVYLSVLLFPLLILMPRAQPWWVLLAYGALFVGATYVGLLGYRLYVPGTPNAALSFRIEMPFMNNLVYRTGLGPFTIHDVYNQPLTPAMRNQRSIWHVVEWIAIFMTAAWASLAGNVSKRIEGRHRGIFVFLFGVVWAVVTLLVSIQAYGIETFDRYLLTPIVALILAFGALFADDEQPLPRPRFVVAGLVVVILGLFSTAGTHDYFRWQSTRWSLYQSLLRRGVSPRSIDAGYEPNGWYNYDAWKDGSPSPSCLSFCRCTRPWFCIDDSYRITAKNTDRYLEEQRVTPPYLLMRGPSLLLLRRPDP